MTAAGSKMRKLGTTGTSRSLPHFANLCGGGSGRIRAQFPYETRPAGCAGLKNQPKALDLFNVSEDQFGHLEHADLALAVEHGFERIVRIDHGPLFLILATVLLDVVPEFLGELGTWERLGADDCGKFVVGLHRSHEGGVRFTF